MRNLPGILLGLSLVTGGWAADPKSTEVAVEAYGGWTNCFVLRGGDCKAVVVPGVGGRILHYSINGENIIYENPELWGDTLRTRSNFWAGGYQCDIGPEIRGIPDHKWLWQGPWSARVPRAFTVHTFSEPALEVGLQLDKEIVVDPDTGDLGITQRMRNVVNNDVSFCLWDRTLSKGGGFAMFPLSRKSRFKAGWSIRQGRRVPEYRYEGDNPKDDRVRILEGVLVAQAKALPEAREMKVGADSDAGWIAYARGKILFVKYFPVFENGNYSDGGNTVEFYCSERVAELEPLSPEIKLKSGENYSFPEKWTLIELEKEVTTYDQARALVKRIPRSPFAK
jgi:hypothetical protein